MTLEGLLLLFVPAQCCRGALTSLHLLCATRSCGAPSFLCGLAANWGCASHFGGAPQSCPICRLIFGLEKPLLEEAFPFGIAHCVLPSSCIICSLKGTACFPSLSAALESVQR